MSLRVNYRVSSEKKNPKNSRWKLWDFLRPSPEITSIEFCCLKCESQDQPRLGGELVLHLSRCLEEGTNWWWPCSETINHTKDTSPTFPWKNKHTVLCPFRNTAYAISFFDPVALKPGCSPVIRRNGRESEWTPGVGDGQGGLACCDSWGRRVGHNWATELNWTERCFFISSFFSAHFQRACVIAFSECNTIILLLTSK